MSKGTPKTLREAIANSAVDRQGTLADVEYCELHVRDFLAQRFGAAMLDADEKTEKILKLLFEEIIAKEKGKDV